MIDDFNAAKIHTFALGSFANRCFVSQQSDLRERLRAHIAAAITVRGSFPSGKTMC